MLQRFHPAFGWLVLLTGCLACVAAVAGLFWPASGQRFAFDTLRGQRVEIYGQGLYAYDTVFTAGSYKGTDAVTLAAALPALALAYWQARRGSQRGGLLLAGVLAVLLYNAASMALGAAYNSLFLVYVAWLGASFLAFVMAMTAPDWQRLPDHLAPRVPHRSLAAFLVVAGLAPLGLWLSDVVGALAAGRVPELLGSYSTMYTYAVDLALVVPATFVAAWLVLRRAALGYLLAGILLVLLIGVGLSVVGQTVAQVTLGIRFSPGVFVGFVGSWVVLALIALRFLAALVRPLPGGPARGAAPLQPAAQA